MYGLDVLKLYDSVNKLFVTERNTITDAHLIKTIPLYGYTDTHVTPLLFIINKNTFHNIIF